MPDFEWLIIGGGIHGTCIARALVERGHDVALLDPAERLLERWTRRADAVAMAWLRSPVMHHLAHPPNDLHRFAHTRTQNVNEVFSGSCKRPALDLFSAHCTSVVSEHGLSERLIRGQARHLERDAGLWRVVTDDHTFAARNVVLALGPSTPRWPSWARRLRHEAPTRLRHVFDDAGELPPRDGPITIVGGGISAAQIAIRCAARGQPTTLLRRHRARCAEFDYDSRFGRRSFLGRWKSMSLEARERRLEQARRRGTIPPGLLRRLERLVARGRVRIIEGDVRSLELTEDGLAATIHTSTGVQPHHTPGLMLATGLETQWPETTWLQAAIERERLASTRSGRPRTDEHLRWAPGLFVTSAWAELELGPAAPNILGARWAAEEIIRVA